MSVEQLSVGDLAPDFTLKDQHGQDVSLATARADRSVLVVFYPFAFSGICGGELSQIRDDPATFDNERVRVLTVSCDPAYTLRAWAGAEQYTFPLLSDFWPHGAVAQAYGVFNQDAGFAVRGSFLVDTQGVLRWSVVNGPGEPRDPAGYREAFAAL